MPQSSAPVNVRGIPASVYSPLLDQRQCARCHQRDQWRQVHALGGGWLCCPSRELLAANRDTLALAHQCGPACLLTAGGAA